MGFEHHSEPVIPFDQFIKRIVRYTFFSFLLLGVSLGIGVLGYHFINDLPWIDALLNASMILTGMGPIDPVKNDAAKLFASFYSIFSGVVFLSTVAVFLSPIAHRFLHKLHVDEE